MEYSVENLVGFLYRSRLLPPEEIRALHQRWQSEAGAGAAQTGAFTRWLAARQYLTEYQANLLARGQVDDFFLNDYQILERVGRGRMAGVFKAAHKLGQIVAIKVLPPSRARNPHLLARFEREARLAVRLRHPNIVRSFQLGHDRGLRYLVMEYLEGETLDEVLQRRRRLPPEEAVRIVHQVLLGLQHLQEQGMVHRDLKPSNMMLVPAPVRGPHETTLQATVKILDIGLAREMYDEETQPKNEQLTADGILLGTPDYMAPEQARDPRSSDIRADIYSLGCVLYHLMSGQVPFPDRNLIRQLSRHATEQARPLREFNPEVPEGLEQIVQWMMAKKPQERYATPVRAAQALEMFLLAGHEPAELEDAPQMQSYLTWLEKESPGSEPAEPPPAETYAPPQTVAAPAPAAEPMLVAVEVPVPATERIIPIAARVPLEKKDRRAKEAKAPEAKPAEAAPVSAEPAPPSAWWQRLRQTRLSRREWVLMGIGAGLGVSSCIVAEVVVMIFRWLFGGRDE